MELKGPEIFIGAVIVYLLMKPRPEEQIPAEEEEEAVVEAEPDEPKVVRRAIPPGFLTGLEADPVGPSSTPTMSKALRLKLARITDP